MMRPLFSCYFIWKFFFTVRCVSMMIRVYMAYPQPLTFIIRCKQKISTPSHEELIVGKRDQIVECYLDAHIAKFFFLDLQNKLF